MCKKEKVPNISKSRMFLNGEIDRVIKIAFFVGIVSPILIYLIILTIHKAVMLYGGYEWVEGSRNAWIGFSGSIIGGSMTLIALLFTLRSNEITRERNMIDSLKPYVNLRPLYSGDTPVDLFVNHDDKKFDAIYINVENLSSSIIRDFKVTSITRTRTKINLSPDHEKDKDKDIVEVYGSFELLNCGDSQAFALSFLSKPTLQDHEEFSDIIKFEISCEYRDVIKAQTYNHMCVLWVAQSLIKEKRITKMYYAKKYLDNRILDK